jgi:hypothetical protein
MGPIKNVVFLWIFLLGIEQPVLAAPPIPYVVRSAEEVAKPILREVKVKNKNTCIVVATNSDSIHEYFVRLSVESHLADGKKSTKMFGPVRLKPKGGRTAHEFPCKPDNLPSVTVRAAKLLKFK